MLDARFKKLATDQISVGFAEQDAQNDRDVAAQVTELMNREKTDSSWAARSLGELIGNHIQRRGDIALERIERVAAKITIQPTDDFEAELTAFLEGLLKAEVDNLREKLHNTPTLKGKAGQDPTPLLVQIGNEAFDEAVEQMFNKLRSEIALFAAEYTAPTMIVGEAPAPIGVRRSYIFPVPQDSGKRQAEPDNTPKPERATGTTSAPESTEPWLTKTHILMIVLGIAAIAAGGFFAWLFG